MSDYIQIAICLTGPVWTICIGCIRWSEIGTGWPRLSGPGPEPIFRGQARDITCMHDPCMPGTSRCGAGTRLRPLSAGDGYSCF